MMTFLFDQKKAMDTLETMEAGWGGDITTRMAREAAVYEAAKNPPPAPVPSSAPSPDARPVATGVNATAPQAPE
jgi:penicillin-binding protein 2